MAKILSIDDNGELQTIYQEVFTDAGHTIIPLLAGKDALSQAIMQQPDVILLDLMLADGVNGFDILRDLKRHTATQHIPIIALTNLDSEEKHAIEMGADAYMIKSNTSFDVLLQKVAALVAPAAVTAGA